MNFTVNSSWATYTAHLDTIKGIFNDPDPKHDGPEACNYILSTLYEKALYVSPLCYLLPTFIDYFLVWVSYTIVQSAKLFEQIWSTLTLTICLFTGGPKSSLRL